MITVLRSSSPETQISVFRIELAKFKLTKQNANKICETWLRQKKTYPTDGIETDRWLDTFSDWNLLSSFWMGFEDSVSSGGSSVVNTRSSGEDTDKSERISSRLGGAGMPDREGSFSRDLRRNISLAREH